MAGEGELGRRRVIVLAGEVQAQALLGRWVVPERSGITVKGEFQVARVGWVMGAQLEAVDSEFLETEFHLEAPDAVDPGFGDTRGAARLDRAVADPGAARALDTGVGTVLRGPHLARLVQRRDRGVALDAQVHAPQSGDGVDVAAPAVGAAGLEDLVPDLGQRRLGQHVLIA